jgi:hypothetical protein
MIAFGLRQCTTTGSQSQQCHTVLQHYYNNILQVTYLRTIPHHEINFLRTRVSTLPQSLDQLGFGLISIVHFRKGVRRIDSTLQLQEFGNHPERLVARVNRVGRNSTVRRTEFTVLVRDLAFGVFFQLADRHKCVRLLVVTLQTVHYLLTGSSVQFGSARQENGDIFERRSDGNGGDLTGFQHVGIVPDVHVTPSTESIDGTGVTADEFQLVNKRCISLRDNKRVANLASQATITEFER